MRAAIIGLGAVGTRAARQLASSEGVEAVVLSDARPGRAQLVADALGTIGQADPWNGTGAVPEAVTQCDVAVLAGPSASQLAQAGRLVAAGCHVVSTSDALDDVEGLLDLGPEAAERGVVLVVGAVFSPGLSCVLAKHGSTWFEKVDEIHVARIGTGGPECAHQHHRSFGGHATEWLEGAWVGSPAGSGRELCWFPDPVGAADCYRGALAEPLLLTPAFPGVSRVSSRLAGTRRDRLTARLPMLRPPHPEGAVGAIRVELRGWRAGVSDTVVLGSMDRPAVAGGAVAALAAVHAAEGLMAHHGAAGLADLVDPLVFLRELARRGVRAAVFEGSEAVAETIPTSS